MGDGSFGFTVGELETIVRHKAPLLMVVFSNSVYGWIKASQKAGYDKRYSVDFDRTDHARIAEAYGVKAWRVEDPAKLDAAIKAALARWPGPDRRAGTAAAGCGGAGQSVDGVMRGHRAGRERPARAWRPCGMGQAARPPACEGVRRNQRLGDASSTLSIR